MIKKLALITFVVVLSGCDADGVVDQISPAAAKQVMEAREKHREEILALTNKCRDEDWNYISCSSYAQGVYGAYSKYSPDHIREQALKFKEKDNEG